MMNIMLSAMIVLVIANIMMTVCTFISFKSSFDREKLSPFECGFDQKSSSRIPFSLQFFLIAIIFLIFDVEIALILPSIINLKLSSMKYWLIMNILFIIILIVGILHEMKQGALNWVN